jgi:hypothetical protein
MQDLIKQEQFEMEVLDRLKSGRFLDRMVFGGGTMLRLCFGEKGGQLPIISRNNRELSPLFPFGLFISLHFNLVLTIFQLCEI